jgi:transcriptional regulator GlxA family with amidase domain
MIAAADAVVDEFPLSLGAGNEQRRKIALADARRQLDEHLASVVERAERTPGRTVAVDPVAEIERVDVDGRHDWRRGRYLTVAGASAINASCG